MKEHKHAEVLRAIADGKEVQWANPETCDGCWHDLDVDLFNPLANSVLRWRVKPEPKPDYFFYGGYDGNSDGGALYVISNDVGISWTYRMKITIDGETNEPKHVELVK